MKLAEALAFRLQEHGVTHVYGVNGGAALHVIHGICDVTNIKFISTAHEQGAGFAADAHARLKGLGVALATSGPGASNLTTAICASFQDSIPVLYIVGNVATFRSGRDIGVPFYGFQELDFVSMVKSVTKYAIEPRKAEDVLPELDKCIEIATTLRMGPVVLSVPDDLQRAEI